MRVLHVCTDLRGGGIEAVITTLAVGTDGETGICWCPGGHAEPPDEFMAGLEAKGVQLFRVEPPFMSVRYPWRLRSVIRSFRPHVLHLHGARVAVIGGLVGRLMRVRAIVYTEHLQHVAISHRARRARELLARLPHWTVFVSAMAHCEAVENDGPLRSIRGRCSVIHNGIDLSGYGQPGIEHRQSATARQPVQVRTELGLGQDTVLLGCVGLLWWAKGQEFLVRALPLVQEQVAAAGQASFHEVHLVLVGSGPNEGKLRTLAQELGVNDRVHLLGWRSDIPRTLKALDIYVQPSISEGFGLAVVEACAAGLPVVAGRVGGIPEIIRDRLDGLLVAPGDVQALADGIVEMLRDPAMARNLAANARARVFAEFSADTMVEAYERLYLSLLGNRAEAE